MGFDVGTHAAKAVAAALGRASTGNEQIAIQFQDPLDDQTNITWYGYFTDGTFERTIKALRLLGWKGTDLFEFSSGLPEGCDHEVEIVVAEETYEGKTTKKVKWVNAPGGSGGIAMKDTLDEKEARGFAARMKARVAALHAGNGAPKPEAKKAAPPKRDAAKKATPPPSDRIDEFEESADDCPI